MVKIVFKIISLVVCFNVFEIQANKRDDLWKSIQDNLNNKISLADLYIDYGYASRKINIDSAYHYIQKGLDLAQGQSQGTLINKANIALGILKKNEGNYNDALGYYYQALKVSREYKDQNGIAKAYNNIGVIHQKKLNLDKALEFFNKSLDIKLKINASLKNIANTYSNIGIIYKKKGDYGNALKNYSKGLELRLELEDKNGIKNSYINIAGIHKAQKQYENAKQYYDKAIKLAIKNTDKKGLANVYNNLGALLRDQEKYREAIIEYRKALNIRKEIGDEKGLISTMINMGESYNNINPRKGLQYIEEGLSLAKEINAKKDIMYALMALAGNYNERGKFNEAIDLYNEAIEKAKALESLRDEREIEEDVYEAYLALNDYENALEYHIKYHETFKNLKEKENQELIEREHIRNLNNEHDAELNLLNVKAESLEKEQKQQQITFLLSGLAGLIVISLIIRSNRLQRKSYKIIETKKAEVEVQKNIAEKQKEVVELKNKEITSSIQYAKRIQTAILPSQKKLDRIGLDCFVAYQPKDIVSGDFYWFEKIGSKVYFTAADCTGHGVPGAMVSVVCSNALTKAVRELGIREPSEILDKVSEIIEENFDNSDEDIADGMDLSLVCLDLQTLKMKYAGANNPLYIVKKAFDPDQMNLIENGVGLIELKADIQPIGKYFARVPFTQKELQLSKGDIIYSFSDGFADQFGGPKGKKYKYKPFKRLLMQMADDTMEVQRYELLEEFNRWRILEEQIDDVCIVGVRV